LVEVCVEVVVTAFLLAGQSCTAAALSPSFVIEFILIILFQFKFKF